jgi:hypothetical protein
MAKRSGPKNAPFIKASAMFGCTNATSLDLESADHIIALNY